MRLGRCFRSVAIMVTGFIVAIMATGLFSEESSPSSDQLKALDSLTAELPAAYRNLINADPSNFFNLLQKVSHQELALTILVDKTHALPADYVPGDLINLDSVRPKLVLNKGNVPLQLRKIVVPDLLAMSADARKLGITLDISSAYRSYAYQQKLFARYVKEDGLAEAERESAHAGSSQHQLGLAIDFGSVTPEFAQTKAGAWLLIHAHEYGFSLSYPQGQEEFTGYMHEPWHYRYIGRAAAEMAIRYFNGSQQALLVFLHQQNAAIQALIKK